MTRASLIFGLGVLLIFGAGMASMIVVVEVLEVEGSPMWIACGSIALATLAGIIGLGYLLMVRPVRVWLRDAASRYGLRMENDRLLGELHGIPVDVGISRPGVAFGPADVAALIPTGHHQQALLGPVMSVPMESVVVKGATVSSGAEGLRETLDRLVEAHPELQYALARRKLLILGPRMLGGIDTAQHEELLVCAEKMAQALRRS